MFTKKHFEAIADILNKYTRHNGKRNYPGGKEVDEMINVMVTDFADFLETQNERFDKDKFFARTYK
jgi:protein associated with RNAse G/E